mgnify:FL=1
MDRFSSIKWTTTKTLHQYKRLSVVGFIERTLVKMGNYFFIVAILGLFLSACSATITSIQENSIVQNEDKKGNTAVSGTKKSGDLPNWLLPPPKGALVPQVITIYEHPVTGERYQTNTGGYTIVVE